MHTTRNDDVTLAYRTFGEGERDVLLLHGWMTSGAVFDDVVSALDLTGLRVIVPDLRGCGDSGRATGHSLAHYAADVRAVWRAAGARRPVLVGHSMGGQIAQWLAAETPDDVAGLVLVNTVPAAGIELPPDAARRFRTSGGRRDAQATILGLATKALPDAARERLLDVAGRIDPACIAAVFDVWTRGGFAERLGAIRAPTLVVATDDPFLPAEFLRAAVTSRIAGARQVRLPGAGHYPPVERAIETAALLEAFVAGQATRR